MHLYIHMCVWRQTHTLKSLILGVINNIMGRSPCCDKSKVKRGTWSPEEDEILRNYLQSHGTAGNWIALPHKAGLKRCGKSCRLRWMNYLRPDIKHGDFTQDEEHIICKLYNNIGSRWSVIASHLPGRTDNDVKNYWNTKLKKKFMETTAFQIAPHQRERVANDELINFGSSRLIQGGSSDSSSGNDMNSRSYPPYLLEQDFWLGRDEVELLDELVRGIWGEEEEAEVDADLFSIFHADSTLHGATQTNSPTPL